MVPSAWSASAGAAAVQRSRGRFEMAEIAVEPRHAAGRFAMGDKSEVLKQPPAARARA